jgi:hypothetical protein
VRTNQYWCELMSGIQGDSTPYKDISCARDYAAVVNSVTPHDVQELLQEALTVEQVLVHYSSIQYTHKNTHAIHSCCASFGHRLRSHDIHAYSQINPLLIKTMHVTA